MECPFCHAINTENSKFCGNCGKQLQIKCPRCGAMCIVYNKFCPQCGENINADIFWQDLKHYDGYRVYEYEGKTDCVILVKLNHRYTFIIPRVSIFPISNFEYEDAYQTFFGIFWVKKNGKWGSINAITGKQILDCVYDEIEWDWDPDYFRAEFEEERRCYPTTACVKCDSKWGVVHVKGEHSIACSYDEIKYRTYTYGCYFIKRGNKYGYIKSWHLSINCKYDELRPRLYSPDCDYFIARINGQYGVIDVSEKIVVAFVYDMIEFAYSKDIYILKKNGYYGAYYRIKDKLIQCIYKTASDALKV